MIDLNYELSSCFHRPLYIFERTLRDRIDQTLANYLNDSNWLINHENHPLFTNEHIKVFKVLIKEQLKSTIHLNQKLLLQQLHLLDLINFYFPPYGLYYHTTISTHYPFLEPQKCKSSFIIRRLFKLRDIRNSIFHHNEIVHDEHLPKKFKLLSEFIYWMTGDDYKKQLEEDRKRFLDTYCYVRAAYIPVDPIEY